MSRSIILLQRQTSLQSRISYHKAQPKSIIYCPSLTRHAKVEVKWGIMDFDWHLATNKKKLWNHIISWVGKTHKAHVVQLLSLHRTPHSSAPVSEDAMWKPEYILQKKDILPTLKNKQNISDQIMSTRRPFWKTFASHSDTGTYLCL